MRGSVFKGLVVYELQRAVFFVPFYGFMLMSALGINLSPLLERVDAPEQRGLMNGADVVGAFHFGMMFQTRFVGLFGFMCLTALVVLQMWREREDGGFRFVLERPASRWQVMGVKVLILGGSAGIVSWLSVAGTLSAARVYMAYQMPGLSDPGSFYRAALVRALGASPDLVLTTVLVTCNAVLWSFIFERRWQAIGAALITMFLLLEGVDHQVTYDIDGYWFPHAPRGYTPEAMFDVRPWSLLLTGCVAAGLAWLAHRAAGKQG